MYCEKNTTFIYSLWVIYLLVWLKMINDGPIENIEIEDAISDEVVDASKVYVW